MSEELIVSQCSPTMAGLKTGSLFTCPAEDEKTLFENLRRLNKLLVPKGVRILPVKRLKNRILIYMYRPHKLNADIKSSTALKILKNRNYPVENTDKCVAELIRRIKSENDFPHEIGLFLGYPAEDVDGFINHGAKKAKLVGVWKVYGDEVHAQKTFALYDKCTRLYRDAYRKHSSFDRLIVRS